MARRPPRLKASEVISVLCQHGFVLISQKGSHQKWRNQETMKQVIVPYHKGKQLPLGTLKGIIDGSGIPEGEFGKRAAMDIASAPRPLSSRPNLWERIARSSFRTRCPRDRKISPVSCQPQREEFEPSKAAQALASGDDGVPHQHLPRQHRLVHP